MKKRVFCLLLSVCLLIGIVAVSLPTLAGEDPPTYYVIDAAREGDTYYVTVRCNWEDFTMLNGEFLFTYPTDEWELLVEDRDHSPIDPANNLTRLPGAEVGVDKAAGEIRLAFISSDGAEFTDGWVTMLVLPFRAVHAEAEDLKLSMDTTTLVAAGDTAGEKVDVLEQENAVPEEIVFEKPVAEVPTTVITTTTTTTAVADSSTTTVPVIDPTVGAEHYAVEVFVADGKATVTVKCDYRDYYMMNGQFVFSYPTETVDLIVGEKVGPMDPTYKMSNLPTKEVKVDEAEGQIRVAFMTTTGVEFLEGPVTVLKMEFDIKDTAAKAFELAMKCDTLMAADGSPRGYNTVEAGEMPSALRWNVSLLPTPTTTVATTTTTTAPTAPPKKFGDVNGDNKVDSTDARLTLQCAVQKIPLSAIDGTVADVNGDNKVDSTDARLILQYAVKKISSFPKVK